MAVRVVRETLSVRARLVEYEGVGLRFDLRQFYVDDHGQTLPTAKGAGLKREHIAELRRAIDAFERETAPSPK